MIKESGKSNAAIPRKLLAWYEKEKRMLPWRETADPYRIWISEIMLQQTQVDTVVPYYHRFLTHFPTLEALAGASLQEVLKVWENMGYYSRARHLHAAAGEIIRKFNGRIPADHEDLLSLPGIGDYTAGAILSIAYGQKVPAIDGNVRRILSRLFAIREPLDRPDVKRRLHEIAAALVPRQKPGHFNQALMDLGATVCKAGEAVCSLCPVNAHCQAKKLGLQEMLPFVKKKSPIPHRREAAAVIRNREGQVLMVQRPAKGLLASLWKFPGGFLHQDAGNKEQLQQLVREELGVPISVGAELATVDHAYTHFRVTLSAYEARICGHAPPMTGSPLRQWISLNDLNKWPLAKVERLIIKALLTEP